MKLRKSFLQLLTQITKHEDVHTCIVMAIALKSYFPKQKTKNSIY